MGPILKKKHKKSFAIWELVISFTGKGNLKEKGEIYRNQSVYKRKGNSKEKFDIILIQISYWNSSTGHLLQKLEIS